MPSSRCRAASARSRNSSSSFTWAQLGQHSKPIVVANIAEFWTPFLGPRDYMRTEAFIRRGLEVHLTP